MKVALYARCSTKKQDLESQETALKKWAAEQSHEAELYADLTVSGRKDNRKGIKDLLDAARRKEFKLVGVLELSRIGRSIGFIHRTIEELNQLGIQVVLTKNNTTLDYSSLEGRALIGGLALAADIEWMLIQERNARGRQAIKDRGIRVGRKRKDVSLTAIQALQAQGMSLRQVAQELGVSAPTILRRVRKHCDDEENHAHDGKEY